MLVVIGNPLSTSVDTSPGLLDQDKHTIAYKYAYSPVCIAELIANTSVWVHVMHEMHAWSD